MTRRRSSPAFGIALRAFLVLACAAVIFPFLWMILASFKTSDEIIRIPPTFLPARPTLGNYAEIQKYFPIWRFLWNSVWTSVLMTAAQVLIAAMAAYVFSKIEFKGRSGLFAAYLATMMIPVQVTVIPLYLIVQGMGLQDSYAGLILPSLFSAFGVFLLRQHMGGIPNAFMEAAFMDGAGYLSVFTRVILPLSVPVMVTFGIFAFMNAWNAFLWPLIIINSKELMTLPLGLSRLSGRWNTEWNILMSGNVVSFVPILIVYLIGQKYFVKGLTLGGVKG
jgi:ABC-type sugar transport system, permease component